MPFEIQTYTDWNGWKNQWFYDEGDGLQVETFTTAEDAEAALDEFLRDMAEESWFGASYDPTDFRIRYFHSPQLNPPSTERGDTP